MRFLVDNAVSPAVSVALREDGHDSLHARDLGIQHAADEVILDRAVAEHRILISADTDFSTLMARRAMRQPSVILFRHGAEHRPQLQARILRNNLRHLEGALSEGVMVTIEPTRIRVRQLPLA